ncbi:MAG: 3-deoxy-7-phosphoheptulonate synthase [Christensenellales bacterium]|nr:3-deoxy-7-phosphoheptulonate synthase [Christensenellales bacterium]
MIIVLKQGTTQQEIDTVTNAVVARGVSVSPIVGTEMTILGLTGDTSRIDPDQLESFHCVERIMKVAEPFKKANRAFHPAPSEIKIGNTVVGGKKLAIMAGPCSVESNEQITAVAQAVKDAGATVLRGGAFKPRTSPYSFQGLAYEGLDMLCHAREQTGLPIVTELMSPYDIDTFVDKVDCIQVGARNMQNFDLLKQLGKIRKPILLKRGLSATIEEWLMSAEYIMAGGNEQVILCERGIRTFETYTRNTLDLSAICAVKKLSHLPVIVDPSHSTGKSWMVQPIVRAAIAVGADGVMIEVHNDPAHALCDGAQSITPAAFVDVMADIRKIAEAVGREV